VSGGAQTLQWTPTLQEYERALGLWRDASGQKQRMRNRGMAICVFAILLMGVALAQTRGTRLVVLLPLLLVLAIGVIWFRDLIPYWGLRRTVRSTPALLEPVTVTVDREGVRSTTASGSVFLEWPRWAAHIEIADLVLLGLSYESPAVSGILPRSAAPTGAAWDAVAARVRTTVPMHPRLVRLAERDAVRAR
jgi:hypothetical protein